MQELIQSKITSYHTNEFSSVLQIKVKITTKNWWEGGGDFIWKEWKFRYRSGDLMPKLEWLAYLPNLKYSITLKKTFCLALKHLIQHFMKLIYMFTYLRSCICKEWKFRYRSGDLMQKSEYIAYFLNLKYSLLWKTLCLAILTSSQTFYEIDIYVHLFEELSQETQTWTLVD